MGELGRKLTIRMPDNPRLREAGIGGVHVDAGGRVAAGSPVMSLVARRNSHIVRAPRAGRVLPLVGVDDRVIAGDPLFILHLDEEALAEDNRRALVPAEKKRWSDGIDPELIEPILRGRKAARGGAMTRFAGSWGRPILAIALYVLACFAILPLLHVFSEGASWLTLLAMSVGAVLFAAVIYRLYPPEGGALPRWTVRMVAASWVGLAGLAIFYRPEVAEELTVARAPVAEAPVETPVVSATGSQLGAGHEHVPLWLGTPTALASGPGAPVGAGGGSGVASGGDLGGAVTPPDAPSTVPAEAGQPPRAHGVTVRPSGRVTPGRAPGTELAVLGLGDMMPTTSPLAPVVRLASAPGAREREAPVLAVALQRAAAPEIERTPRAAPVVAVPLGERPVPSLPAAAPDLATGSDAVLGARTGALPPQVAAPPAAPPEGIAPGGGWLASAGVPVLLDGAAPRPAPALNAPELSVVALAPSSVPGLSPLASRLVETRDLDPVRLAVRGPGEEGWIELQLAAAALRTVPVAVPRVAADRATWARTGAPMPAVAAGPLSAGRPDPVAMSLVAINGPLTIEAPPAPALSADGPSLAAPQPMGPAVAEPAPPVTLAAAARVARPVIPVPEPEPVIEPEPVVEPEPAVDLVMRDLLYLYVDDPRRDVQPGLGEAWEADLPEDVAGAIARTEIEEVQPLLQVSSWCPAAGTGGDRTAADFREAWVDDRMRLMRVRIWLEPAGTDALEAALPVFGDGPPGFFHNRLPLMGGGPGDNLMGRGASFVRGLSNRFMDPNTPEGMSGGHYFDDPVKAARALFRAGCRRVVLNGGAPSASGIGKRVVGLLGG